MRQESIKTIAARVRRRNRAFAKLSPEKKKVVVAKDVLMQIDARKYRPTRGTYFEANAKKADVEQVTEFGVLLEKIPTCNVCAVGSVFASVARYADDLALNSAGSADSFNVSTFGEWNGRVSLNTSEYSYLIRMNIFSDSELREMEAFFESSFAGGRYTSKKMSATKALSLIMENVVRNGRFDANDKKFAEAAGLKD